MCSHHATLRGAVVLRNLGNSFEGTILGTEENCGGPVVGEVLAELASRASGSLGNIVQLRVHSDVEGIL